MLFKKKEYICIPLSAMYVYGENPKEIISSVSTNNSLLSDGTEIKLFLEYTPNNKDINNFSSLKEIITGTRYERTNENNPLETFYSEKTKPKKAFPVVHDSHKNIKKETTECLILAQHNSWYISNINCDEKNIHLGN